ncbi:hypothetical protein Trydic_g13956 [Trypoxylus dichotomus]
MSLKLFITALESAFKQLNWGQKGVNIGGKYLNNLHLVDDIVSDGLGIGPDVKQQTGDIFKGDIPTYLKMKAFNQCVFPVLAHGSKTLTMLLATTKKLTVTQRKMKRPMLGTTPRDHIRNEDVRRRTCVNDVVNVVTKLKWNWVRHVTQMRSGQWTKRLLEWRL